MLSIRIEVRCAAVLLSLLVLGCTPEAAELGDAAWAAKRYRDAVRHYRDAVECDPGNPSLSNKLCSAEEGFAERLVNGAAKASIEELQALIESGKGRPMPWPGWRRELRRMLAGRLEAEGRVLEAVAQHTALGREWPDCPTCPALAQAAAQKLPATAGGEAAFRDLVQAWPREALLHESFARWLADQGRIDRAVVEYEKLLSTPAVAGDLMLNARLQVALKLLQRQKNGDRDLPKQPHPE